MLELERAKREKLFWMATVGVFDSTRDGARLMRSFVGMYGRTTRPKLEYALSVLYYHAAAKAYGRRFGNNKRQSNKQARSCDSGRNSLCT